MELEIRCFLSTSLWAYEPTAINQNILFIFKNFNPSDSSKTQYLIRSSNIYNITTDWAIKMQIKVWQNQVKPNIINFQAERLRAENIFEEWYKIEEQQIPEELWAANLLLLTSLGPETKQQGMHGCRGENNERQSGRG